MEGEHPLDARLGMPSLDDADFRRLSKYIEEELGIRMPESKRIMLESRLSKRMRRLSMESFSTYVDYVFSAEGRDAELINMIDAVTTNKTDFFREADHFEFLLDRILPEHSGDRGSGAMAFWCAGCSTGEEPYTLAMVLEEYRERDPSFGYSIFASDISTQVLAKAEAAVYTGEQALPIPMSFKKKYLLRSRDKSSSLVRVRPELRARVRFGRINFMDERYDIKDTFDVVFCRNVIIYFERAVQERILARLLLHLRSGGWLLIGHSETITGMSLPMRMVAPTIYRKI
jgi:chemotaxis protein methyltransferase CheR